MAGNRMLALLAFGMMTGAASEILEVEKPQ
jgi:hypothetical protein